MLKLVRKFIVETKDVANVKRSYMIGIVLILVAASLLLLLENNSSNSFADAGVNKKIYLVIEGKTVEDGGFNQSLWRTLQHFSLQAQIKDITNPQGDSMHTLLGRVVKEKPGLVFFTIATAYDPEVETIIKDHPEIKFVVVDYKPTVKIPNYRGLYVESQEGSFLAGYVAGRMTKTGKVGFLGGFAGQIMDQFRYGFAAGAAYAAWEQHKPVTCLVRYANTYYEKNVGAEIAASLYKDGCDIIFQAAGLSGVGAIEEAKRQHKYIIGVDTDQSNMAPEQVLTSVLKNMNLLVINEANNYLSLDSNNMGNKQGLAIGATGLPSKNRNIPYHINRDTKAIGMRIVDDKLTVPYDAETYQKFLTTLK